MPIYEYECPEHGIQEHLVLRGDEPELCDKIHSDSTSEGTWICSKPLKKVMSISSVKVDGAYSYSLERPSDIRLRERNQALKNKVQ